MPTCNPRKNMFKKFFNFPVIFHFYLINLVEFMLSTSFPRSSWFFLQIVTIIGNTSNLSSNFKEPSKYSKVFMTDPSNWRSSNLFFCKVGFPLCSLKFLGISITSMPVSICISKSKLLILTFSMSFLLFNFFYILVFVFYCKDLHIGFVFFNSFNVFLFWICIMFENGFFFF